MAFNRKVFLLVGIVFLLIVVFYLASLQPFGDVSTASLLNDSQPELTTEELTSEESTTEESTTEESTEPAATTAEANDATVTEADDGSESNDTEINEPVNQNNADSEHSATDNSEKAQADSGTAGIDDPVTRYSYRVVNSYPHDPEAFTQGLIWYEDGFYEGTGLRGRSSLRKVNLTDGVVTQKAVLADQLFGEGLTIFDDRLYQLTWQAQIGLVYERSSFELITTFNYPTEGWGLTHDNELLIMSDGTAQLYFLDPATFEQTRAIDVTRRGQPQRMLNELEFINGRVYANVWQTDEIVIIDSDSGIVQGEIDLTGLLQIPAGHNLPVDVLNGIAYDAENERLFVTGKLWPQLYEIELVEMQ